jgi:hypothetical protein
MVFIWNFLKHSTKSSFCKLAKKYPNVVIKPFTTGMFPIEAVRLDEALIQEAFAGLTIFFSTVFDRFFDCPKGKAQWDYDDFFLKR